MKIFNSKVEAISSFHFRDDKIYEARNQFYEDALDIDYATVCKILLRAESSRELHSFQEQRRVAISGVLNLTVELVSTYPVVRSSIECRHSESTKSVRFDNDDTVKSILTQLENHAFEW